MKRQHRSNFCCYALLCSMVQQFKQRASYMAVIILKINTEGCGWSILYWMVVKIYINLKKDNKSYKSLYVHVTKIINILINKYHIGILWKKLPVSGLKNSITVSLLQNPLSIGFARTYTSYLVLGYKSSRTWCSSVTMAS